MHDLYFHTIVAHVAFYFESEGSFRNGSAERGESLLAIFKRFVEWRWGKKEEDKDEGKK